MYAQSSFAREEKYLHFDAQYIDAPFVTGNTRSYYMSVLRQILLLLGVGLLASAANAFTHGLPHLGAQPEDGVCQAPVPQAPSIKWISQDEASRLLGDQTGVFADARSETEYNQGHIAGAVHVPTDSAGVASAAMVASLRSAQTVIVYCDTTGGCSQSSRLAHLLLRTGLEDVRVLEGGMPEWMSRGLPAEAGACRTCK